MHQFIEREVALAGVTVLVGVSEWHSPEDWFCPPDNYVVCQRLSDGHSPLKLAVDDGPLEAYPQVRSLGFMPSTRSITMYPLERPLRTLNCFFGKDYFEAATEIDAEGWYERSGSFMALSSRRVGELMGTIHHELVRPGFGAEALIEAASIMIAVEMARLGRRRVEAAACPARSAGPRLAAWQIRRIRERLAAAPNAGYPAIKELAEICGVSSGHLMRTFKATTGQSLHKHIMEERIDAARRMLVEDRLSIKQIAGALGFCNIAHFSTAFRRAEVMSPSEFRIRAKAVRTDGERRAPPAAPGGRIDPA